MPDRTAFLEEQDLFPWRVVAASVEGTSHTRTGQPCQDAHAWTVLPSGFLVAAVSDGAGSAALAEVGAATAAQAAVDSLAASLAAALPTAEDGWRDLLLTALRRAREAIEEEARSHGRTPRDLAATLIVLVAAPDLAAVAQVGDGAVVVGGPAGDLVALTAPQSGEYVNETTFLVSPDALATAQFAFRPGAVTQVALFSDGLQRLALRLPEAAAHAPFFGPLFRFVADSEDRNVAQEQLAQFLRSPRLRERTDDDLTLVLATYSRTPLASGMGDAP
jgi:hypothetical protein